MDKHRASRQNVNVGESSSFQLWRNSCGIGCMCAAVRLCVCARGLTFYTWGAKKKILSDNHEDRVSMTTQNRDQFECDEVKSNLDKLYFFKIYLNLVIDLTQRSGTRNNKTKLLKLMVTNLPCIKSSLWPSASLPPAIEQSI